MRLTWCGMIHRHTDREIRFGKTTPPKFEHTAPAPKRGKTLQISHVFTHGQGRVRQNAKIRFASGLAGTMQNPNVFTDGQHDSAIIRRKSAKTQFNLGGLPKCRRKLPTVRLEPKNS